MFNEERYQGVIAIWEEKPSVGGAMALQVEKLGYSTRRLTELSDAAASLGEYASCLLAGVKLGDGRLDRIDPIVEFGCQACVPVILFTDPVPMPTIIRAMRRGVFGVIPFPSDPSWLSEMIREAIAEHTSFEQVASMRRAVRQRKGQLSRREVEVLDLLVAGLRTKDIASRLGITTKTVETHRSRVFAKMQAQSCVELLRMELMSRATIRNDHVLAVR